MRPTLDPSAPRLPGLVPSAPILQSRPTSQAPAPPVASVQPTPRELDADRLRLLLPSSQQAAVTQVYAGATPGTRAESDPLYRRSSSSPQSSEAGSDL